MRVVWVILNTVKSASLKRKRNIFYSKGYVPISLILINLIIYDFRDSYSV